MSGCLKFFRHHTFLLLALFLLSPRGPWLFCQCLYIGQQYLLASQNLVSKVTGFTHTGSLELAWVSR
ncbi:MAG: hypothetical protein ACI9C4_001800 [Paraglaciecola sp.]|jgi:hypothetical protein